MSPRGKRPRENLETADRRRIPPIAGKDKAGELCYEIASRIPPESGMRSFAAALSRDIHRARQTHATKKEKASLTSPSRIYIDPLKKFQCILDKLLFFF